MLENRIDLNNMCLDEYEENTANRDIYYKRATGALPEMECSKALAQILANHVKSGQSILDVGCAVGHYYRSLKNQVKVEFKYTGVDPYPILIDKAKEAWADEKNVSFQLGNIFDLPFNDDSFDYIICNNVILHLSDIVKPIGELMRVARKKAIIRHNLYDKSYRIQFVYNDKWWPYTDVKPEDEFDSKGEPRAFSYFNIHSFDYFNGVIHKHSPSAKINYIKDDKFSAEKINSSAKKENFIEPTQVIDNMQVSGCIILPHYFVEINL
jgi:ubiquinone/menaquinone biosynthesis C-methylase UbiE